MDLIQYRNLGKKHLNESSVEVVATAEVVVEVDVAIAVVVVGVAVAIVGAVDGVAVATVGAVVGAVVEVAVLRGVCELEQSVGVRPELFLQLQMKRIHLVKPNHHHLYLLPYANVLLPRCLCQSLLLIPRLRGPRYHRCLLQ